MNENERSMLWEEYDRSHDAQLREKIILEYASLVKIVAGRLSMYLGYAVEYEDLVSYGIFGLIDAIDKFDCNKGIKFETYASLRIRGAILDQIRKMDWIPRSLRQKQKKMDSAMLKLETELGRPPTDEEIAKELEIPVDEYLNWQGQTNISNVVSLEEFMENSGEKEVSILKAGAYHQPEHVIERQERKKILEESLELLTEKERKVILLYYFEELTLKEISSILEVSESRISQLHTKALLKLRESFGNEAGDMFRV